jgi:hypothetical protein
VKLLAAITVLAALAVAASSASAGQPAFAALKGYHYCGKIANPDTGGTTKIYGRRVNCHDSKSLWHRWRRHLDKLTCDKAHDYCEVTHVHHFRCVFGGDDFLVRLRCTRGKQRMRAYWGG